MQNYSQAHQDVFVLECLGYKRNGTFIDLGCNHPIETSNTYLLEKEYNWSGVCVDIDERMIREFSSFRKCFSYVRDCSVIEEDFFDRSHYDYLSLDLEPPEVTLACLKRIPFEKTSFSVITYEHDFYRSGQKLRSQSRNLFIDSGYTLLCADVKYCDRIFEDWYINEKHVPFDTVSHLHSSGLDCEDLKKKCKSKNDYKHR